MEIIKKQNTTLKADTSELNKIHPINLHFPLSAVVAIKLNINVSSMWPSTLLRLL